MSSGCRERATLEPTEHDLWVGKPRAGDLKPEAGEPATGPLAWGAVCRPQATRTRRYTAVTLKGDGQMPAFSFSGYNFNPHDFMSD